MQNQPLAIAVPAITTRSNQAVRESATLVRNRRWKPCMYCPPMPVHIEDTTNPAPMQNARRSPWPNTMPITSHPVATNQTAPTNSWLNSTDNRHTRAHQKAKNVVVIKSVRKLNRKGIPGSSVGELALRGGGGGVGAGESVLIVESATA